MDFVQPIRDPEKIEAMKIYLRAKSERDYMMFLFGIHSALRISDILQIKKKDVIGKHLILIEKKTKKKKSNTRTNKKKEIFIAPILRRELKGYIEKLNDDDYLFQSRESVNKPIVRSTAYRILSKAGEACGLERIGTHSMRKTFGYHYYAKTKNIAVLQKLYSHSAEAITLRYIGVDQDQMDKAMREMDY